MRVQRTMPAAANLQRFATEAALDQREAERDCYRQLTSTMRGRAVVIQMASHGSIGKEKAAELAWRDSALSGCRGSSCRQGRVPCREGCRHAEMACADDDAQSKGLIERFYDWLERKLFGW
jgi:hypothetical protein